MLLNANYFSVHQFLENFQSIAESNNFFDPGFKPSEMGDIPELYRRIIDDPALVHDKLMLMQSELIAFFNLKSK